MTTPYSQSQDEANRARYLAEDRINAARSSSGYSSAELSKETAARISAESKVSKLKEILRIVRDYHIHSLANDASFAAGLCCELGRRIDEALRL